MSSFFYSSDAVGQTPIADFTAGSSTMMDARGTVSQQAVGAEGLNTSLGSIVNDDRYDVLAAPVTPDQWDDALYSDFLQFLRVSHSHASKTTQWIWLQFQEQVSLCFHSENGSSSHFSDALMISSESPEFLSKTELEVSLHLTELLQISPSLGTRLFSCFGQTENHHEQQSLVKVNDLQRITVVSGAADVMAFGAPESKNNQTARRVAVEQVCAAAVTQWLAEAVTAQDLGTHSEPCSTTSAPATAMKTWIAVRQWAAERDAARDLPFSLSWRGRNLSSPGGPGATTTTANDTNPLPLGLDAATDPPTHLFHLGAIPPPLPASFQRPSGSFFAICHCHIRLLHIPSVWQLAQRRLQPVADSPVRTLQLPCGGDEGRDVLVTTTSTTTTTTRGARMINQSGLHAPQGDRDIDRADDTRRVVVGSQKPLYPLPSFLFSSASAFDASWPLPGKASIPMRHGSRPVPVRNADNGVERLTDRNGDRLAACSRRRCIGVITSVCFRSRQQEVPNEWATLQIIQDLGPGGVEEVEEGDRHEGQQNQRNGWRGDEWYHRCSARECSNAGGAGLPLLFVLRRCGQRTDARLTPSLCAEYPEIHICMPTSNDVEPKFHSPEQMHRIITMASSSSSFPAAPDQASAQQALLHSILQVGQLVDLVGCVECVSCSSHPSGVFSLNSRGSELNRRMPVATMTTPNTTGPASSVAAAWTEACCGPSEFVFRVFQGRVYRGSSPFWDFSSRVRRRNDTMSDLRQRHVFCGAPLPPVMEATFPQGVPPLPSSIWRGSGPRWWEEQMARFVVRCWTGFRCVAGSNGGGCCDPLSVLHFLSIDAVVALWMSTLRSQYWQGGAYRPGRPGPEAGAGPPPPSPECAEFVNHGEMCKGNEETRAAWTTVPLSVLLVDEGPAPRGSGWLVEAVTALANGIDPLLFRALSPSEQRRCQARDYLPTYEVKSKLTSRAVTSATAGGRGSAAAGRRSTTCTSQRCGTSVTAKPATSSSVMDGSQFIEQIRAGVLSTAVPHTLVLSQATLLPASALQLLQSICQHASDTATMDLLDMNQDESDQTFLTFGGCDRSLHASSASCCLPEMGSLTSTTTLSVKRDGGHRSPYQIPASFLFGLREGRCSGFGGLAQQLSRQPLLFALVERVDVAVRPTLDSRRQQLWESVWWRRFALLGTEAPKVDDVMLEARGRLWQSVYRRAVDELRGPLPPLEVERPPPPRGLLATVTPSMTEGCGTLLQMYFLAAKAVFHDSVEAPTMQKLVKLTQTHALLRIAIQKAAITTTSATPSHTASHLHPHAHPCASYFHGTATEIPVWLSCCSADAAPPTTALIDALVGIGLCDSTLNFLTGKTVLGTCVLRLLEEHYNPSEIITDEYHCITSEELAGRLADEWDRRSRWVPPPSPPTAPRPMEEEERGPQPYGEGYHTTTTDHPGTGLGSCCSAQGSDRLRWWAEEAAGEEGEGERKHEEGGEPPQGQGQEQEQQQTCYVEQLVMELLEHFRNLIAAGSMEMIS